MKRRTMLVTLLAVAAGPTCTREVHVTKPLPIRQIINALKSAAPPESAITHHGFPVPRMEDGRLVLAVIACPASSAPNGMALRPPSYLAFFDPATGDRTELRVASAAELGGPVGPGKDIGVDRLAPGQTADAFLHDQETLYSAIDVLLPLFTAGRTDLSPEQKKAAAAFRDAFPRVTETALAPYYKHVGQAWFGWLDRVSR